MSLSTVWKLSLAVAQGRSHVKLLFLLAGVIVGCSPPHANDLEDCNLPYGWVTGGLLLVAPEEGEFDWFALISEGGWRSGETGLEGPCREAMRLLSEQGMVDPTRAFSRSAGLSWVAAKTAPSSQFKTWYTGYQKSYATLLVADDRLGYVQCSAVSTSSESHESQVLSPIFERQRMCLALGLLRQGAGFWSGFGEGIWPFTNRDEILSSWYVGGYWAGRVLFWLLVAVLVLSVIGLIAVIVDA